jgi:hypothetical protein
MKKGLILALMMAMVALVVSVSATAPTIGTLNEVIIGNLEDVSGANSLMRWNDAVNIATKVTWNNPTYTYDKFHIYLYNNFQTPLGATETQAEAYSPDGLSTPLTTAEYTLIGGGGTTDASALTSVNMGVQGTASSYRMSLLDFSLHPYLNNGDPYHANAPTHGVAIPAGYDKSASVTLIAGVTSGTVGMVTSEKAFLVICQDGQPDGGATGGGTTYDFTSGGGSDQGWFYIAAPLTGYPSAAQYGPDGTNGIGHTLAAAPTGNPAYSLWNSPYDLDAAPAGGVWRVVATINTDNATRSPGYRFTFNNLAWSHFGNMIVLSGATVADFSNENFPTPTTPFEARIYFEPPVTLNMMEDGGFLATNAWSVSDPRFTPPVSGDTRKYELTFDIIGSPAYTGGLPGDETYAGDSGRLAMSSLNYAGYSPSISGVEIDWGLAVQSTPSASPIAFNAVSTPGPTHQGGWINTTSNFAGNQGTVTIGANTLALNLNNSTGDYSIASASSNDTFNGNAVDAVSSTLYRLVMEMSVASKATAAPFRVGVNNYYALNADPYTTYVRRAIWEEAWGSDISGTQATKSPYFHPAGVPVEMPCAPSNSAANPSVVSMYIYSHNQVAAVAPATSTLIPTLSLLDIYLGTGTDCYTDTTGFPGNVWSFPNSVLTYNYVAWQNLGSGD